MTCWLCTKRTTHNAQRIYMPNTKQEMKLQLDAFVRALRYNCFSCEFTTNVI